MRLKINIIIILLFSINQLYSQEFKVENIVNKKTKAVNQYWDIVQDNRGIMYFANPNGVYEFDGLTWQLIELQKKVGVYSLKKNSKGRIFVGGEGELGYLAPTRNGVMTYVSLKSKLPESFAEFDMRIVKIEIVEQNIVFFCDYFLFVFNQKNETFKVISPRKYFYSSVSVNNKLYLIDEGYGLMCLEGDSLKPIKVGENIVSYFMMPISNNKILIISPNQGILLFSPTNNSIEKLNNGKLQYDFKSGQELKNGNFALGSVSNGCIIISATGEELYKMNKKSGLEDNAVYSVHQNSSGAIWLGLSKGLAYIYERDDKVKSVKDSSSVFRINIRSCTRRANESIVFGGAYSNIKDSVQSLIQPVEQTNFFHYKDNNFRFTFASTQYQNTPNLKYQYFLEGLEQKWTTWTDRPYSEFTNLNWGKYVLKVRAKNEKGEVSKIGTYSFSVKIPWYESWWFLASQIGFILLLLGVAVVLYRMGKSERVAGKLVTIVVVIIFEYAEGIIGPVFEFLAIGIAVAMFLSNIVVATVISPIEEFTNKSFKKLVKRKEKKEDK